MNIALLGYGKMGKAIQHIAEQRNHTIVLKSNSKTSIEEINLKLKQCDVAIEFSSPISAIKNIELAFSNNKPVVCGSTGWLEQIDSIKKQCNEGKQTFFYASNYSIGVNLFFEMNKKLAALMNGHPEYKLMIEETHHQNKKDYPSGTALTLSNDIIEHQQKYISYKSYLSPVTSLKATNWFPIFSQRKEDVPGTHAITWYGADDEITITHTALSRMGFATGAVIAAEWLLNKKGHFTMSDLLK